MLKKIPVIIIGASALIYSSKALAVATGVELSSVDIPMDGATISLPGLTETEIKKSSDCNPEKEECPDPGYDYYFSTDVPLYNYDMGTAIINTKDGVATSTFTNQPFGSLTLSPTITNADGLVTSWVDPLGKEYALEYDSLNRVISSTGENDLVTRYQYDGYDRPARVTNPAGETTKYEYDSMGRTSAEISPEGSRSEINYDPANNQIRISNFKGTTVNEYDSMGRIVRSTAPKGEVSTYQYDSFSRGVVKTGGDGVGIRTTYDLAGNRISEAAYTVTWSPYDPVEVGPKSKVGTESVESKVVKAAAGKVLGGLLGGFGGGKKAKKPKTKRDPARRADKSELYHEETDTKLEIRPNWVDDKLHISVHIKDSDDKATFQYIYLVDQNGNILGPESIDLYKIWVKHTLTVSWTESHYVDGALVSQTSGGWTESWVTDLGTFNIGSNPLSNIPGIWQMFGYDRAHAGARTVGAKFNIDRATFDRAGPLNVVTHITQPKLDPVSTIPMIGQLFRKNDKDFRVETIPFISPTIINEADTED